MEIGTKNFNKLKQNDRIEYLLRKESIENRYGYTMTPIFLVAIFVCFITITVFIFICTNNEEMLIRLKPTFILVSILCVGLIGVDFFMAFFFLFMEMMAKKELFNKFFEVQLKTNGKK